MPCRDENGGEAPGVEEVCCCLVNGGVVGEHQALCVVHTGLDAKEGSLLDAGIPGRCWAVLNCEEKLSNTSQHLAGLPRPDVLWGPHEPLCQGGQLVRVCGGQGQHPLRLWQHVQYRGGVCQ